MLVRRGHRFRHDIDALAVLVETHPAVLQREERPIAPGTDIGAGNKFRSALPDKDARGGDEFPAKRLDPQPLADAVASVADAALTFLVCHIEPFVKP